MPIGPSQELAHWSIGDSLTLNLRHLHVTGYSEDVQRRLMIGLPGTSLVGSQADVRDREMSGPYANTPYADTVVPADGSFSEAVAAWTKSYG